MNRFGRGHIVIKCWRWDSGSSLALTLAQEHPKSKPKISFSILSQQQDELRLHVEEAMAIKTRQPDLNRRQEELGTGFLPWAYIHATFPPFHQAWTWISPPTFNNNVTSFKLVHELVSLHFWHHPLQYWQHLPPLSTPLTPPSPHSLHYCGHHHLFPTPSPSLSIFWMSKLFQLAFDWWWCCASKRLFNRYGKIKIIPSSVSTANWIQDHSTTLNSWRLAPITSHRPRLRHPRFSGVFGPLLDRVPVRSHLGIVTKKSTRSKIVILGCICPLNASHEIPAPWCPWAEKDLTFFFSVSERNWSHPSLPYKTRMFSNLWDRIIPNNMETHTLIYNVVYSNEICLFVGAVSRLRTRTHVVWWEFYSTISSWQWRCGRWYKLSTSTKSWSNCQQWTLLSKLKL